MKELNGDAMTTGHAVMFAVCLSACLGPAPDNGELYSSYVLPAGTDLPRLDDDPAAAKKLDVNDGLEKTIPLRSGFSGGAAVSYWDFGTLASAAPRPMYIFRRLTAEGTELSTKVHPDLIDAIPGDAAYSPLRQLFVVYVTSKWRGELITTMRALEDAAELNLVQSPQPLQLLMNCVVTAAATQIQEAPDGSQMAQQDALYHGQLVKQFCVGPLPLKEGAFTPGNAYSIRRMNETQPIADAAVYDSTRTGVWRNFEVTVSPEYETGDATDEAQLFDRSGSALRSKPPALEYRDTGAFLNRPIFTVEGNP